MRKLIIERKKSFVGCLASVKIYIEDETSKDIILNGVHCRKIGKVKNGEKATFEITENAVKVFAVAEVGLNGEYNYDFVKISEGQEEINLSGKYQSSFKGYSFLFDNVTDEEVLKLRKKGSKFGILVWIASFIFGIGLGILFYSVLTLL